MIRLLPGDKVRVISPPGVYFPTGEGWVTRRHPTEDHKYAVYINGYGSKEWYPGTHIKLIERKKGKLMPEMAHVKIKCSGTQAKIELFHFVMYYLDPDWPWQPEEGFKVDKFCAVCGGAIYLNPNFTPDDIRLIVKQIDESNRMGGGLKVKIKKFNVQNRCSKDDPDLPDQEESIGPPVVVVNAEVE